MYNYYQCGKCKFVANVPFTRCPSCLHDFQEAEYIETIKELTAAINLLNRNIKIISKKR